MRKASYHPARWIFRRNGVVSGWERWMLRAKPRMTARFSGALSFLERLLSSSKTTSRTQCSWFSIVQCERWMRSNFLAGMYCESRKDRTVGGLARAPCRRLREGMRSEEHTSELQSHLNLVCPLLLLKKKIYELRSHHAYS